MSELKNGATLQGGKYRILKTLGQGGFGITYLAVQSGLERKVAIKEFFMKDLCERDGDTSHVTLGVAGSRDMVNRFREKFLKEARNIAKLNHPNIVRIIDVFEENGTAYYVMEYVEKESLAELVQKQGCLSEPVAIRYILQVAKALGYIHQQKMNHLDIKPSNIMLNEWDQALLIDFGVSKQYDAVTFEGTTTTPVGVSHGYSPAEQYKSNGVQHFSPASDVYALAATLYKLLTGETPPEAMDVLMNGLPVEKLTEHKVSRTTISAIKNAMKGINDRTQSVSKFLLALSGNNAGKDEMDEPTVVVDIDNPGAKKKVVTTNGKGEHSTKQQNPGTKKKVMTANGKGEQSTKQQNPGAKKKVETTKIVYLGTKAVVFGIIAVICFSMSGLLSRCDKEEFCVDTIVEMCAETEEAECSEEERGHEGESCADNSSGESIRTFYVNGVSFKMVKVSGGTFTMGATSEQGSDTDDDERPTHSVTLSTYRIGQTEVTQALWKAVMGSNPSNFKGDNLPVESVSWYECQGFIRKLNQLTGKKFRLPTEAEWEYAARGGSKSNGYKYAGSNILGDVAWHNYNSSNKTHVVGTKKANELGIYDMSGNVLEWCQDWYGEYKNGSQSNPTGPTSGSSCVMRGGCGSNFNYICRLSDRYKYSPDYSGDYFGLRLVLSE